MEKYLIHSNELHLIDAGKIHQAVEKMVESLDLAAGSTSNFDLYQVVESYFKDLEKRRKINCYHFRGINRTDRYVRPSDDYEGWIKRNFPITPDNLFIIE